jgi:hypothetical protein
VIDYALILTRRFAGSEWTLNGEDYNGLIWLSSGEQPSKEALDALWDEVVAEVEAERVAVVTARDSARAKLKALGLTDDEITALGSAF